MINKKMSYETFTEFCERAYELRELYDIQDDTPPFLMDIYRAYVYSHNFSERYGDSANDLCWDWLLSNCYDEIDMNDLYSMLGNIKRGK